MALSKELRRGQWFICKFKGDNGDLIVGCVESVRTKGVILLTNPLIKGSSKKFASVLSTRNLRVRKSVADKVVAMYKLRGKRAARALAVHLSSEILRPRPAAIPPRKEHLVSTTMAIRTGIGIARSFGKLSSEEKRRALRLLAPRFFEFLKEELKL